jgi:chromosome segregation protein
MRLTTIKLAGFKSFVDPTTLQLTSNMVGVVGPNGCGKSNIIDAIRWVMGESAASRLRGDLLTDVIFSGSSARRPVGQATVELIFDNSDGAIQGEYGQYGEISVKRLVSRDGQSSYFLNGARCRRRDVTDLFLGTGLGPRSYSIIEQGMISQIIDAHPDELRGYLEEAAGISKYKERRKETESRIKATRENLDRVRDVRDEVDKQLEHLHRQARAAERWKALKAEQAHRSAALQALEYRSLQAGQAEARASLSSIEVDVERQLAAQRDADAELEALRGRHEQANGHFNEVQAQVYRVGADIARVEQQVQHNREMGERLRHALSGADAEHARLTEQIHADRAQHATLEESLAADVPRLETLQSAQWMTAEAQQAAEAALADWQERWNSHTRESGESSRAAEVERTRLDYLDRQQVDLTRRHEALSAEQQAADLAGLRAGETELATALETQRAQVATLAARLEEQKVQLEAILTQKREQEAALNDANQQLQTTQGRQASLEALQHAALGQEENAASNWLAPLGLGQAQRLGSVLQVDEGWDRAVETVLAGLLDAVLVDEVEGCTTTLDQLGAADLALLAAADGDLDAAGTLAAHVRGPVAARQLLSSVQTADSLADARARVGTLGAGLSIITRDGEWLAPGWARVRRAQDNHVGVLARERELRALAKQIAGLRGQIDAVDAGLTELRTRAAACETGCDELQNQLYAAHRLQSELAGQLEGRRAKLETAQARVHKVGGELAELAAQLDELREQERLARARLDASVGEMGNMEDRRRELEAGRRSLLEAREEARMNAREAAEQAHALALSLESRRASLASLDQALLRTTAQLEQIASRREELRQQLAAGTDPSAELETERQTYLEQRLLVDKQLVEARRALEECVQAVREHEQARQGAEQTLAATREALAEQRLRAQALQLHAEQLAAAIAATGLELEPLLAELAETDDAERRRAELVELEQKITRLEPVNLAAIQEHAEQGERKVYLDKQLDDLVHALATLEDAIKKIDRETRQRFKETFDQVNAGVQALFPKLFGGGHAYLELTGDDLLNTGVSIMARPPGKRVSNITLLSGGEKALTAVTLVFSIFNLNPSPFCLLDEVDAPLDEANVVRFSKLVQELSEKVQFIFISHNKATMEAADQLCGVTMREPGVSRLVQVDLAEAAKLTEAA